MTCTIGASAPSNTAVGVSQPTSSSTIATSALPSGAIDGAVAGARGGAMSTHGGGGTAVAGAAGVVGAEQLAPILAQLTEVLQRLASALPPVTGGGGGGAHTPSGCGCGGASGASPTQERPATREQPGRREAPESKGAAGAPNAPRASKADVSRWVSGDTQGLNPVLLDKLAQLGERMGTRIDITSGHRSRAEQEVLYQKYLDGTGNLAAKPGSSNHESGNAADAKIGGTSLASNPKAKQIAAELGLHFPVPGEPWHVELR